MAFQFEKQDNVHRSARDVSKIIANSWKKLKEVYCEETRLARIDHAKLYVVAALYIILLIVELGT